LVIASLHPQKVKEFSTKEFRLLPGEAEYLLRSSVHVHGLETGLDYVSN
jgi:hypothetical protein